MRRLRMIGRVGASERPRDPTDVAAYWSARRRLGLMERDDELAFETWLADPANRAEYDLAESAVDTIGALAAAREIRDMRAAALAAAPPVQPVARRRYRLQAAAVLALVLVGTIVASLRHPAFVPPMAARPVAPMAVEAAGPADTALIPAPPKRYATRTGEHADITLEDGSVVSLDTATILDVAYSAELRDVRLIQGQALFQVAKNRQRPFVVTAGDRRITAVGTEFNVRVDQGRVGVVLVEGHVAIDPIKRAGLARILPQLARYDLDPGEQLIASSTATVAVTTADTSRATSWRSGKLIFRDDTVAAVVAEMNRYSPTQLVVDDPRVASLRVSGVFATARPENFVAALTASYPISAEKRSPQVTALVWRQSEPNPRSP